jgi:hypothetical protein
MIKNDLSPKTRLYIATSGAATLVTPDQSDEIAQAARAKGMTVDHDIFQGMPHYKLPIDSLIKGMLSTCELAMRPAERQPHSWRERVMGKLRGRFSGLPQVAQAR